MSDSPNAHAKWSKYKIDDEGNLVRGKLALLVAPVYSSQFTKIGRLVVNADILHPRLRNLPREEVPSMCHCWLGPFS